LLPPSSCIPFFFFLEAICSSSVEIRSTTTLLLSLELLSVELSMHLKSMELPSVELSVTTCFPFLVVVGARCGSASAARWAAEGIPLRAVASAGMMYYPSVELSSVELPSVELASVEREARRVLQKRPTASRSWRRAASEQSKRFRWPCAERVWDETPRILATGMAVRRIHRGE
jgi:hypothetical protein